MTKNPQGPGETSLRDFIEAVGSGEEAHGAVSTAAVAGGLGTSLLLMVAALPQTRSDSVGDRTTLFEAATALTSVQQQLIETIETETAQRSPGLARRSTWGGTLAGRIRRLAFQSRGQTEQLH